MENKICAVKDCKTVSIDGSMVHGFSNGDIRQSWNQAVQQVQPDFFPPPYSVICCPHFTESDFTKSDIGERKKFSINWQLLKLDDCKIFLHKVVNSGLCI